MSERSPSHASAKAPSTEGRGPGAGSGTTRREVLRHAALALTALGTTGFAPAPVSKAVALQVHQEGTRRREQGGYEPQAFLPHEWQTLGILAEMIIPADDVSGSAVDAGAPEFVDLLASNNQELATIFTAGFLWLDHEMRGRAGVPFREASEERRHELLAQLSADLEEKDPGYPTYVESIEYQRFEHYTTDPANPVAHGLRFWGWLRRLVIDAFYTSPMGIADVGYVGNEFLRSYEVPDEPLVWIEERRGR